MNQAITRQGSQLSRTWKPATAVSATAAGIAAAVTYKAGAVVIFGLTLGTPLFAAAIFIVMFLAYEALTWYRDRKAQRLAEDRAVETLDESDEVRRINRVADAPMPSPNPA